MSYTTQNAPTVGRLLRQMAASTNARMQQHDVIFNSAAEVCEMHVTCMDELANLPGETLLDKVRYLRRLAP